MIIIGIIFSVIAGAAMSIQGVFNTRLSERAGLFESNAFVQGTAFVISLIVMLIFGGGNIGKLFSASPVYLSGGILGMVITVTVMLGIKNLSPTVAISVILISQLTVAALIDTFGLFETEKIAFNFSKIIGLILMISGIIIFKR